MSSPLTVRTVVRWIRPSKKIQYHFGEDGTSTQEHRWIPDRYLFQDDTRIDTLTKLYYFLDDYYKDPSHARKYPGEWPTPSPSASPGRRQDLPIVAWDFHRGLLLTPESKWEAWKANPWKLKGTPEDWASALATLPQNPIHESQATQLTQMSQFAFVCMFDFPGFQQVPTLNRWYSLYNDTKPVLTKTAVLEQTAILSKLVQDSAAVSIHSEWIDQYNEMGDFTLTSKGGIGKIPPPKVLFDLLPISASMPFVQWKESTFLPPLYRLYKNHTIENVEAYMNLAKVPISEQRIQVLFVAAYKQQPVVFQVIMVFGKKSHYYIHVKVKERSADVDWLKGQVRQFKAHLQKFSNDYQLVFTEETTHLKARYVFPLSFALQKTHLSSYGWLFHVQKTTGAPLVLTYLRSANVHQRLDPETFIQSQMAFMDDESELVRVIQNTFMVPEAKAKEMLQEYNEGRDLTASFYAGKKRSWVEIPATVSVVYMPTPQHLLVQCDRFLNTDDLNRMVIWMRGMLAQLEFMKKHAVPSPSPKQDTRPPVFLMDESPDVLLSSSSASSARRSARSSSSAARSSSSSAARSDASSILGGGDGLLRGGTYDLIEPLKNADPEIFIHTRLPNNTSRYPRLCSANTNQQPVVLTQDEMKRIDDSPYKKAYDSKILYGSDKDPKKHHYYFCPRIWCPISKVPLTPEQYESLGHKCPAPHSEDPWLFYDADYWGRDASTPHHIGFHKKQGTNNLCLPCCKRLPEKDAGIKKCSAHVSGSVPPVPPPPPRPPSFVPPSPPRPPSVPPPPEETKEEYYLLHFSAPISAKRWGVLPEILHENLKPGQPYAHCYNQLKTEPSCMVRKGIHHRRDSLLNALGYITTDGHGGKREWLAHLEKHFTPKEFLSIHNGWGVSNFIDPEPILPQKHIAMVLKWREWVQGFPAYIKTFHLETLVQRAALVSDMTLLDQLRLSRELAIYVAWRRFWEYLTSSEPKNIYLIYDLLYTVFQIRLIVWDKHSNDDIYLKCPLSDTADVISLKEASMPYAMVMYENTYYEPVELKSRGVPGKTRLDDRDPMTASVKSRLDTLTSVCAATTGSAPLQSLMLLASIPKTLSADALLPKKLVLSPAMTLIGVLLDSGIYIQWKHAIPLRYLSELQALLQVKHVVYLEDLENQPVPAPFQLPTHQVSAYMRLLKELGLKWNVQSIGGAEEAGIYTRLTLKPMMQWNQLDIAVIPTGSLSPTEEVRLLADSKQAYWIRLQRDVGRKLLRQYASIQPVAASKGLAGVLAMQPFQHYTDMKDVQQVFEEIPLIQNKKLISKDSIYQWFIAIGTSEHYPIYTHVVKDGFTRNEWMFSQAAIRAGLPKAIQRPPKAPAIPKRIPEDALKVYGEEPKPRAAPSPERTFIQTDDWTTLPNKWLQKKHYGWEAYRRAPVPLMSVLAWLLKEYNIDLPLDYFAVLHSMKVAEMLNAEDESIWEQYLSDPFIWRGLAKQMKMEKSKAATVLKYFLKLPKTDQWNLWEKLVQSGAEPVDLDLWLFAHLTRSMVLVLHRSPSGKGVETGERHRFQDFVSSATVFHPEGLKPAVLETLPLVVFFREAKIDAVKSTYFLVEYVPENKKYFKQLRDAPENLRKLIRAVIE